MQVQDRLQAFINTKARSASVVKRRSSVKPTVTSNTHKQNEARRLASVALKSTDAVMDKKEFVKFFVTTLREILDKQGDGQIDDNMKAVAAKANAVTATDFSALGNDADEEVFGFSDPRSDSPFKLEGHMS